MAEIGNVYYTGDAKLDFILRHIADRLDRIEGLRDNPTFYNSSISFKSSDLTSGHVLRASATDAATFSAINATDLPDDISVDSIQVGNAGLKILDTNDSHVLIISPGSDLTANRILTLTTGDAARTVTLSGNTTLNQAVDTTSSPTFNGATFNGDVVWVGSGAGVLHGSVYGNGIGWTQAAAVQNTWYLISDADIETGQLNGITHDGNGKFTVGTAGRYAGIWSCTSKVSVLNDHIQITFAVDGTATNDGLVPYESLGVSKQFPVSGNGILNLSANQTVELAIRTTDAATPDIAVDHVNLTLVMVGG